MEQEKCYAESFQMKYGEGDFLGRVRPAVLMRYVEHVALMHATRFGVSRAFNEAHHMVFLLAKQAIEFSRVPQADEMLTFTTQPEQAKRATFRRVTIICDAQGREVACVDSIWVLMDTNTHRLLRRSPVPFDERWANQIERSVSMKMQKPAKLSTCGTFNATYTNCDSNGHINNANYFDIVCDLIPIAMLKENIPKRMIINYHRELVLGESMTLHTAKTETGIYIMGNKSNAQDTLPVFEAFCSC